MRVVLRSIRRHGWTAAAARAWYGLRSASVERFVFVATTGRSGTKTLTRICRRVPGCRAFHEPYPIMNGEVLDAAAHGRDGEVRWHWERVKSINVLRKAAGSRYYVETNHQFVKTFARHALEALAGRVAIVHLVRDPIAVARSIDALRDHPGTATGNAWWLDPRGGANVIRIADALERDPRYAHPFHRALWYWYEVEARVARLKDEHPDVPCEVLRTEELSDPVRVGAALGRIGMATDAATVAEACAVSHRRAGDKRGEGVEAERAAEMHARFRDLLRERGYDPERFAHAG